eukprot:scaffold4732_cov100-Skeletonema_marinoi.AAC.8
MLKSIETWLHLRPSPSYEEVKSTSFCALSTTDAQHLDINTCHYKTQHSHSETRISKEQLYNTIAYKRRRRCDVSSGPHGVLFLLLPSTIVMSLFTAVHKEAAAWPHGYGRGP